MTNPAPYLQVPVIPTHCDYQIRGFAALVLLALAFALAPACFPNQGEFQASAQTGEFHSEAGKPGNLFPDPEFQAGFKVCDGGNVLGNLRLEDGSPDQFPKPVWVLAQHNSRYNLAETPARKKSDGTLVVETKGSLVGIKRDNKGRATLTLGVFAEGEYDAPRIMNQPWPHLLVTVDFPKEDAVRLREGTPLFFSADMKVCECDSKMAESEYNQDLHCGQVSAYFILRPSDPDSPDANDFIWFGFPVFDSRYDFPSQYTGIDGDPNILGTGKLIYLPGGNKALAELYAGENPRSGKWIHLNANINKYVGAALEEAHKRNFLINTQNPFALEIRHFNLGWECPGTFHSVLQVRNLLLQYHSPTEIDHSGTSDAK